MSNIFNPGGGGTGGGLTAVGFSAGTTNTLATGLSFVNSNGVTFGINGNTITASVGAAGGGLTNINISAGTTSNNLSNLIFANLNGISFGLNGSTITGSHNGLTTARASTDAVGLNTAQTNVTWTVNSSGLSLNAAGYAGTGFTTTTAAGAVIAGTHATNGLLLAIPVFLTTAQPVGAYLTTARASNDAIGLNTALTANGVSMTANSSGLSLNFPAFLTTAQPPGAYLTTARASNDAIGLNTAFTAGPLALTINSSGLSLNAASAAGTTSGFAGNLISGSMTHNTAGLNISLNHPAWLTTAQPVGAYLTTARASNDAIGLNTAQTNVTWTVNSSGLSLNAAGYAGTGTTFAGTNVSASATLNSNGLNLALSAAAGGGGGTITAFATSNTTQSSSGTIAANSLIFAGAGIASVGVSNGSIIVSVPAGGGAGDGGVFAGVSNLGNTAGSTGTVSTGNFVLVGASNITLSQSTAGAGSAATVSIIGPNSSSFVAVSPLGITTGGSTISVSKQAIQNYVPFQLYNAGTSFSSFGQNTLHMQFVVPPDNVTFNNIELYARGSFVSSSNNQAYSQTISYGLYSQETGTNSTRMTRVGSSSYGITVAYSSNTSGAYTFSANGTSASSGSAGTALFTNISGPFHLYMPYAGSMAMNSKYAIAIHISSTTAGNTGPFRFAPLVMTVMNSLSFAKIQSDSITVPSTTVYGDFEMAVGTVTTNAMPATIAFNAMSIAVSRQKLFVQLEV